MIKYPLIAIELFKRKILWFFILIGSMTVGIFIQKRFLSEDIYDLKMKQRIDSEFFRATHVQTLEDFKKTRKSLVE